MRPGYVAERLGGGSGKKGRNVLHTVMQDAVHYANRILVRCLFGSFDAAVRVGGDVHDQTASLHEGDHGARDQRGIAWHPHGAINQDVRLRQ